LASRHAGGRNDARFLWLRPGSPTNLTNAEVERTLGAAEMTPGLASHHRLTADPATRVAAHHPEHGGLTHVAAFPHRYSSNGSAPSPLQRGHSFFRPPLIPALSCRVQSLSSNEPFDESFGRGLLFGRSLCESDNDSSDEPFLERRTGLALPLARLARLARLTGGRLPGPSAGSRCGGQSGGGRRGPPAIRGPPAPLPCRDSAPVGACPPWPAGRQSAFGSTQQPFGVKAECFVR
jgi:hypothetical protein